MKIYNNDQILKNLYPEANSKATPSAGKEFGTILKETVENTLKAEPGPRQTNFINPLFRVQLNPSYSQDKKVAVEGIEKMIDLLDQYRQMLAEPLTTLKKIDPIIKELGQEKEKMSTVLDSLNDDEGLKSILNQTLVTASLEITKFYRGDYIAA